MTCITLLTDFGTVDEYVAVMKGVILSVGHDIRIIDITHHIPPQDTAAAADMIIAAFDWFPKGTVHVIVVDPGVGSDRSIIAASGGGHLFLAPDNGIPAALNGAAAFDRVVRVGSERFFRQPVSATFHGRDIFAPVAARMATGTDIGTLGHPVPPESLTPLPGIPPRELADGSLEGHVISEDRFGNLITNLPEKLLADHFSHGFPDRLEIEIGGRRVSGLSPTYSAVAPGRLLAVIGSRGRLEIAVNCGSARDHCGVGRQTPVWVRPLRENQ